MSLMAGPGAALPRGRRLGLLDALLAERHSLLPAQCTTKQEPGEKYQVRGLALALALALLLLLLLLLLALALALALLLPLPLPLLLLLLPLLLHGSQRAARCSRPRTAAQGWTAVVQAAA